MKICSPVQVLSEAEASAILGNALRVLAEVGVRVPNARILEALAGMGASVDRKRELARFPAAMMEAFLSASEGADAGNSRLTFSAGAYPEYYMPPRSREVRPHILETIGSMTRLADALENVNFVYDGMGVPSDVPPTLAPLYVRLLVWKHTTWAASDRTIDVERARDVFDQVMDTHDATYIREDTERGLRQVIARAERALL